MSIGSNSEQTSTIPSTGAFLRLPPEQVQAYARSLTVALSTSGTSRWYFLEHGNPRQGYHQPHEFESYGRLVIDRVMEIAAIIFADGVQTLFIPGFAGGQGSRNPEYHRNMQWVYRMLVDDVTRRLYDRYQMGVVFRGAWRRLFEWLNADDLARDFEVLEQEAQGRERRLIWYVADDFIPVEVLPLVRDSLNVTGAMPAMATLSEAYYGRPLEKVDIFIGNNKPSVAGLCPPLLSLGDLYYTVSPITYLQADDWRRILYDHLFERRGHYRDFQSMDETTIEEMRQFYTATQGAIIGTGAYHRASQSWRPAPWYHSDDTP
ncbi:MAG: hypothetical protein IT326_04180 [Anaerolineae bacterium]|nr:hypothetical protein [Anaerolineae bacterium]